MPKSRTPQRRLNSNPRLIIWVSAVAILIIAAWGGYQLLAAPQTQTAARSASSPGLTAEGLPYKGNPNAKIVIEEYADFQCPVCGRYTKMVEPVLDDKYVKTGKVYHVFHYLPFIGPESLRAWEAAQCATEQGKFWEYEKAVYTNQRGENQGWFSDDRLVEFGASAGLDTNALRACLQSGKYRNFMLQSV